MPWTQLIKVRGVLITDSPTVVYVFIKGIYYAALKKAALLRQIEEKGVTPCMARIIIFYLQYYQFYQNVAFLGQLHSKSTWLNLFLVNYIPYTKFFQANQNPDKAADYTE